MTFKEHYLTTVAISTDADSDEVIELREFLSDKDYDQFVTEAYKSLWLWQYLVKSSYFTTEMVQELKEQLFLSLPIEYSKYESFERTHPFLLSLQEKQKCLMYYYESEEKSINFLAHFHSFLGKANYSKHHQMSLEVTKVWMQKYKPPIITSKYITNCCK